MSKIGLIDCNNFFVSCERVANPSLEGRPVIVLSNNDGCAIARSNEAKALGIKMAQPIFQIADLIKKHNVVALSGNMKLYVDMSRRVMETLASLVPEIEHYSVDEAFLNFAGMELFDLAEYGQKIVHTTKKNTGIPVCLGIADTKTLAKIANHFAKKYAAYNNVCIIDSDEKRVKALKRTEIGDVWGIGRQNRKKLESNGIRTAFDFTELPQETVRKLGTIVLERTWLELRGTPCIELKIEQPDKKSISVTRTFADMQSEIEPIVEAIATHAASCAEKLRKQSSCAVEMLVFIQTNRFREDLPQLSRQKTVKFTVPTNSTLEIVKHARMALEEVFVMGYHYKRSGVVISKIMSDSGLQTNMFDPIDRSKHGKLMSAMDKLNERYDQNKILIGTQRKPSERPESKQKKSPDFTTDIEQVIDVE